MPTKWTIWIVAALILAAGAWYLLSASATLTDVAPGDASATLDQPSVPEGTGTQPAAPIDANVSAESALLDADLQAIDTQMEAAAQSSASASFDDQPIEQTE
ncbi:MAG: hypothetical protein U1D26_03105 [Patescibacteria group bacterium]|nr:hypothetical protein [bacterium]MDZ4227442.1 hypothetical protein [Patescibacteria group bacterium]